MFIRSIDALQAEELVFESGDNEWVEDWSVDGRLAAVGRGPAGFGVLSLSDRKFTVITSDQGADEGQFSPNGKWLAYNSRDSGSPEVYVVPIPPTGRKVAISSGGGVQPRWSATGTELFYLKLDGTMMSVDIDPQTALPKARAKGLFSTDCPSCTRFASNMRSRLIADFFFFNRWRDKILER